MGKSRLGISRAILHRLGEGLGIARATRLSGLARGRTFNYESLSRTITEKQLLCDILVEGD